ncbi:hypothetical protein Tco_0558438 [Tanacetum coccineum]
MKQVQRLQSINDGDERKHVLDYTNVALHYVEDQRKNLLSKFNSLKQELSSCISKLIDLNSTKVQNLVLHHEITRINLENEYPKDEISDLKKVIEKWTSSKVTLDQLLTEQILGNINSPSDTTPEVTYDTESEYDNQEPLPPLSKLLRAEPMESSVKIIKKKAQTKTPSVPDLSPEWKPHSSTEQLLLTLIKEVKVLKEQIKPSSDVSSSVSQTISSKSKKGK